MKNLSKFDLGMIIAFAVIGLIGGGVWWWLSGQASAAMDAVRTAKTNYDGVSITGGIVVSSSNKTTLQGNIDVLKSQIDPLIASKLTAKDNKLSSPDKQLDSVAWKHDLDDRIRSLNKAAKSQTVKLPGTLYYFSFSRYTSGNPNDDETPVLGKQLLAVEQIATVLIKAPVKTITSIRRTYEEDARQTSGRGPNANTQANVFSPATEPDRLTGFAFKAPEGAYTDYPYEINFDTSVEGLRQVLNGLMNTPYVFVVRSISITNDHATSPQLGDLDRWAGNPTTPSVTDSAPGSVAATISTKGPQYLFENATLHVKTRIDLIEWNGGN